MAEASQIKCPHCGQSYLVQPEQWSQYLGQTINCTRCGREFRVTAPAPAAPLMAPIPQYAQPVPPGQPPQANFGPSSPFQNPLPYYPAAPVPISGWAIASLVCGFLFCIPGLTSIFAIIAGAIGLSQTKEGRFRGRGLAIAGLVLGIIGCIFWMLALIGSMVQQ